MGDPSRTLVTGVIILLSRRRAMKTMAALIAFSLAVLLFSPTDALAGSGQHGQVFVGQSRVFVGQSQVFVGRSFAFGSPPVIVPGSRVIIVERPFAPRPFFTDRVIIVERPIIVERGFVAPRRRDFFCDPFCPFP
jgi:hypothetical protein